MSRTHRKLTAVMFTDVAGYSALVHADEAHAQHLLDWHRAQLRRQAARYGGRHLESTGDGNLLIFDSALAAVECAVAIQHELAQRDTAEPADRRLRIRIGLHQGDVERGSGRVFGDGVNVGARLEPLAPPGGIAASEAVVGQIHGPLRAHFVARGAQVLKNIAEPVELWSLPPEAVPVAAAQVSPGRARATRWPAAVAAVLVLGALGGGATWWRTQSPAPATPGLAILPLENLSAGDGGAEFAGGLHDSLLTEVARIPRLRVISRSSVMRYATERLPVPEIGRALRVGHILEGSVQRIGERIRINVQLIDAVTDEHLWAEAYERQVGDLFELQREISREVARKLHGNLALPALPADERPTGDATAYDLYLRAIAEEDGNVRLGQEPPEQPLRFLEQAVQRDPDFALAHAALARFAIWAAHWARYSEPARAAGYVERAATAARRARALSPELPEALLAEAMVRPWQGRDFEGARELLEQALARRPAYPKALYMLSGLQERAGDLERAVQTIRALLDVDPHNEKAHDQHYRALLQLRRYAEADEALAGWQRRASSAIYVQYLRAQLHFYRTGELQPWKDVLAAPGSDGIPADAADIDRWLLASYDGRFDEAAAVRRAQADAFVAGRDADFRWAFAAGQALALAGRNDLARPYLEATERVLQRAVAADPADNLTRAYLGQIQALLGQREAALASVRQALADNVMPGSQQFLVLLRGQVAATLGERAEAMAQLEWLFSHPADVHAHAVLRDPAWAPLNRDAAFQDFLRRQLPPA